MTFAKYTWLMIVAVIGLSVPFFATPFPPATDLPQHLSQMQLLEQAVSGKANSFELNWFAPGNLIYVLLFVLELIFPVEWAGRLISIALVVAWVAAVFLVARVRNRPAESALLAALLVYNFCFYWGFLNFQLGAPLFLLFFIQLSQPITHRGWWANLGWLFLLYASHSFWFLAGGLVVAFRALSDWPDYRHVALRLSTALPPGLLAAAWFVAIERDRAATAVNASLQWLTGPGDRLSPGYLVDAVFGGLQGGLEPFIAACVAGWLALGLVTNRHNLRGGVDQPLLLLACFFAAVTLFAPDRYLNSVFIARRFAPFTLALLLLALPAPARINAWVRGIFPVVALLIFAAGTTLSWQKYDRTELTGLEEALAAIPEGTKRVLGLDYIKYSSYINGRPFLQIFSYAQAYKGADLNFSFAEHGSSLVSYGPEWRPLWTGGLEWYPERVTAADLCHFDYVLINAEPAAHAHYAALPYLRELTLDGRWRLYSADDSLAARDGAAHCVRK